MKIKCGKTLMEFNVKNVICPGYPFPHCHLNKSSTINLNNITRFDARSCMGYNNTICFTYWIVVNVNDGYLYEVELDKNDYYKIENLFYSPKEENIEIIEKLDEKIDSPFYGMEI